MEFNNYLSYDDFKELHRLYQVRENPNDKNNSRPCKEFYDKSNVFFESVANFLKGLSKDKVLSKIGYSETHDSRLIKLWDKLIENKDLKNYDDEMLGRLFFLKLLQSLRTKENTEAAIKESYDTLNEEMNKGDFDFFDISCDEHCLNCGQNLKIDFRGWKPSLLSHNDKLRDFVPPEPCVEDNIIELNIEFKTSELLIADWFRINEFTEKVSYNKDYLDVSINYGKGREKSTRQSVENFNYITVHVGNSCPSILREGDNFIFGYYDDEKRSKKKTEYEQCGSVCTDLWNVTIIEKQQLINIVGSKVGQEKAKQLVDNYLKDNDYTSMEIEPGMYKLRFHPTYENFAEKEKDKTIPTNVTPFFTLKKIGLENKKKLKI